MSVYVQDARAQAHGNQTPTATPVVRCPDATGEMGRTAVADTIASTAWKFGGCVSRVRAACPVLRVAVGCSVVVVQYARVLYCYWIFS